MKNSLVCLALATSLLSVTAYASTTATSQQIKPNVMNSGASVATIPVLTGEMA